MALEHRADRLRKWHKKLSTKTEPTRQTDSKTEEFVNMRQNGTYRQKTKAGATSYASEAATKEGSCKDGRTNRRISKDGLQGQPAGLRPLSADPACALKQILRTADEMRAVYKEENVALSSGDAPAFMALQEKKLLRAYQYQSDINALFDRADELKSAAGPEAVEALKEGYNRLNEAGEENIRLLQRMARVTERLSNRLIEAARRSALTESVAYGATGAMEGKAREVVTTGLSESA